MSISKTLEGTSVDGNDGRHSGCTRSDERVFGVGVRAFAHTNIWTSPISCRFTKNLYILAHLLLLGVNFVPGSGGYCTIDYKYINKVHTVTPGYSTSSLP